MVTKEREKIIVMRKQKNESTTLKYEKQDIQLDYAELRKAVLVLRSINHKLRQRVIDLLEENEKMTVTDIYIKLRLEQSVASQHLAILRRAGVVATERQGKFIFYKLDKNNLSKMSNIIGDLSKLAKDKPKKDGEKKDGQEGFGIGTNLFSRPSMRVAFFYEKIYSTLINPHGSV